MGRINPNEVDRYSNNSESEFFKLANDGDVARVQFLYNSYDEQDIFSAHKVVVGTSDNGKPIERWVDCKRNYDDPIDDCPFCKAGLPVKPVMIVSMYDHDSQKVLIWERGKMFMNKMQTLFNRYPKLSDLVVEIERHGKPGDKKTTYEIFPMPDVEPVDVSDIKKPNFIGGLILDKSPEEMQEYLDTGRFPENETEEESRPRRSRSRRG